MNVETLRLLVVFGLLGLVVARNLRGFVHFLRPGAVRFSVNEAPGLEHPAVRLLGRELQELGFSMVGRVRQRRPLTRVQENTVFFDEASGDWAVAFPVGREAWLYFLSEPRRDCFVLTADHGFPSLESENFLTGGLPGASPREVYAAHRRQLERVARGGAEAGPRDLRAFVDTAQRFFSRGPGRADLRRQSIRGFVFASAALVWGAMTLWQLLFR
mgnify:CR=1 FL=1